MEKEASEKLRQLNAWWQSTLGQLVIQVETDKLIKVFPEVFGYHILLLGIVSQFRMIEYSVVPYQSVVNPFQQDNKTAKTLTAQWENLPLANSSVDVMVCPHTLDFSEDPLNILQEMHRVLIPEGRVMIFGFNPFSLWRLKSFLSRKDKVIPWSCQYNSMSTIKHELHSLGFQIIDQDYFLFQPPMKNIHTMEKLGFLNKLSHIGLKGLSGIYYIEAQKKVSGVRPLHLYRAKALKKQKTAVCR